MLRSDKFQYGYNQQYLFYDLPMDGERFKHSICVMDDFGNAVNVCGFAHHFEGYGEFLGPDMNTTPAEGEAYTYITYYPTIH